MDLELISIQLAEITGKRDMFNAAAIKNKYIDGDMFGGFNHEVQFLLESGLGGMR
ncbi:MAG: hypothetical protein Q8J78_12975 [Moraxellaceae bacterium]|nr:hypothetical protein [Moraxellaceae bacterium]